MHTEEDTFRKLSRCTLSELKQLINGRPTLCVSSIYKILAENHWTQEEFSKAYLSGEWDKIL